MDVAEERRAIAVFELAQDWPEATREARLSAMLSGEPRLLRAVRAMLRADAALLPTQPPEPLRIAEEVAPERLGAYRLLAEIGRGGMGIVYRAARDDGLYDREVAIKLLRRGLLSAAAGEHFASERRILGRLRHPNIAQIFDAGVAEDGRSYIVMELIEGESIAAAAADAPVESQVAMLREAAEAVDFAHRNFVAHGDIKPGNIVVTDGFGVKLLDFGIAGLLDRDGGAAARSGPGPFTPGFASPERLAGYGPSIADDVFGLGKVMETILGECDDPDLRAVAARAAAADPGHRYATARELIDELDRWRRHEPLRAGASRLRRAALYWRRHRVGIGIAAAAVTALVAVALVTTALYLRANAARAVAERRFEETRSLARYLLDDVTADLQALPGSSPIRRNIADRAQVALGRLRETGSGGDRLALDDARAYARVGQILSEVDVTDPMEVRAVQALAAAESALRRLPPDLGQRPDARLALANTLISRAVVDMLGSHRRAAALLALDEADSILDRLVSAQPRWRAARMASLAAILARGQILDHEGDFAALRPLLARAMAKARSIPPGEGRDAVEWLLKLEQLRSLRGDLFYYTGDRGRGLAEYRLASAALDRSSAIRTDVRAVIRQAFVDFNIASTLSEMGRTDEALHWIERGVAAAARLRTFEDSPRARHIQNIVTMEHAMALKALGRFDAAIVEARASIAGRKARRAMQPDNYEARRAVPVGLRPLAELYRTAGHPAESCATIREAADAWREIGRSGGLTRFDRESETVLVDRLRRSWRCS
jgi:serine/threonine-protein kinase